MKKVIAMLLAAVMLLCLTACQEEEPQQTRPPSTTQSTTSAPVGKLPVEPGEGVLTKVTYTATGADILANKDTVVATIADKELTLGQLQVYYWMNYREFLSEYSYYLTYFGLDYTKSLASQACPEMEEGSWQHFFLESALSSWHDYQSLAIKGEQAGTEMEEQLKKENEELKSSLEKAAGEQKFDSVDALLQADIGPGVTYESYQAYQDVFFYGYSYYADQVNALNFTMEQIEARYEEDEDELAEAHITKESGDLMDVRHILIGIEGEDAQDTTYTDEDWENCRLKAQKLLDEWAAGDATEESFAELAKEHSTDTGSASNGGLYDNLSEDTNFVEEFKAWYLDESRQVGDTGLVKTTYGYHIMYFSAREAQWIRACRTDLENEAISKFIEETRAEYPITVDYEKILLGSMDLSTGKELSDTP